MRSAYVVYHIDTETNDLDVLEVFTTPEDYKEFIKTSPKKCRVWQRPLKEREEKKC